MFQVKRNKEIYLLIFFQIIFQIFAYSYFHFTKNGYPLWNFMWSPIGRFDDFYNNLYEEIGSVTNSKGGFTLYPLSVVFYSIFSLIELETYLSLLIFLYPDEVDVFKSLNSRYSTSILFFFK